MHWLARRSRPATLTPAARAEGRKLAVQARTTAVAAPRGELSVEFRFVWFRTPAA